MEFPVNVRRLFGDENGWDFLGTPFILRFRGEHQQRQIRNLLSNLSKKALPGTSLNHAFLRKPGV